MPNKPFNPIARESARSGLTAALEDLGMRLISNKLVAVIVLGALAHAGCAWLANRWQEHVDFAVYPDWVNYVRSIFGWKYNLVLGMFIGWFAGHRGATAGAAAALIGRIVYCAVDRPLYQAGDFAPYGVGHEIHALIASAVLGAVFGLAGEYLRIKRSSNNPLQPIAREDARSG
jgi:hypothetical protein